MFKKSLIQVYIKEGEAFTLMRSVDVLTMPGKLISLKRLRTLAALLFQSELQFRQIDVPNQSSFPMWCDSLYVVNQISEQIIQGIG